jgi:hypothetical protein
VKTTNSTYPSFEVNDNVKAWERLLADAIPGIHPRYFEQNPRYKGMGEVRLPVLVDYMGLYEEGDWWVLTIVEVRVGEGRAIHLFLPFVAVIPGISDTDRALPSGLDAIAFELVTHSAAHGPRQWKVVDAFADDGFRRKMFDMFLETAGSDEKAGNAYTVIHESGIGKFNFQSFHDLRGRWDNTAGTSVELTATGDTVVRCCGSLRMIFNQTLSINGSHSNMPAQSKQLGQISYRGIQNPEFLVAVLTE